VSEQKLCESAYLTSDDPQRGPFIHGAAMIDRTSGTTHVYLVRGKTTDSVVGELHRQLVRSGRLPRQTRRAAVLPTLLLSATAALVIGVVSLLLSASTSR
jgi:hypothetical protein